MVICVLVVVVICLTGYGLYRFHCERNEKEQLRIELKKVQDKLKKETAQLNTLTQKHADLKDVCGKPQLRVAKGLAIPWRAKPL